jgi:hypothetical protein
MQIERLGALKQTRLSFVRLLMDKMVAEQWEIELDRKDLDRDGVGRLVYTIDTPSRPLSFGVFSRTSSDDEDTDRIIATEWDMWAFLYDGEITSDLMDYQYDQLPHVLEGRATPDVLIWTRANRSTRFFGHIVDSLAAGHQPDIDHLSKGGYLMRSSGYYGNGLNGTKVFKALGSDHPLKRPYMSQMLAVYMLRVFGYDLVEHMTRVRNPDAPELDYDIRRYLGTGNSSGLGIVMYDVNHPKQIHSWLRAREIALARAKGIDPSAEEITRFEQKLRKARRWFAQDDSDTERFFTSKDVIAEELDRIGRRVDDERGTSAGEPLWARICEWSDESLTLESQEVLHSLLIDAHPEVCEGLESSLTVSEKTDVVPEMTVSKLRSIVERSYEWALDVDLDDADAQRFFWYRSIDAEEPRMGLRGETGHEDYERPVDIARQVQRMVTDLRKFDPADTVAEFLFEHPEHRYIVDRIQSIHGLPYAEIRGNPLDKDVIPLYYIACMKSFWGIQKTHPKSKGWVKGTFFQGAPLREDIERGEDSYWLYPPRPERTDHWRDK